MKIVALGRAHEDHNRARVRVMPSAVRVKVAVVAVKAPQVVVNVGHALL